MRQLLVWVVTVMLLASVSGCAAAKKKFIRKRKPPAVRPVVFTEEKHVPEYSQKYYYTTHFTYWKTWHGDLLNYLGQNAKRVSRASEEALNHLEEMHRYLREPKKSELRKEIDVFKGLTERIRSGASHQGTAGLRQKLERSQRVINSGFYYDKVKPFIVPDKIDLSEPGDE